MNTKASPVSICVITNFYILPQTKGFRCSCDVKMHKSFSYFSVSNTDVLFQALMFACDARPADFLLSMCLILSL